MSHLSGKRGMVLLLLAVLLIPLQAGGQKKAILSYDGSAVYDEYSKFTDKVVGEPNWLASLLEKNDADIKDARSLLLDVENPDFNTENLSDWQKQFLDVLNKRAQQTTINYKKIKEKAEKIADDNEKIYLKTLIDYAILNTYQGMVPDDGSLDKELKKMIASLKPVITSNKYKLSDAYRLYAELLSRYTSYAAPTDVLQISSDAKRYAEEAIKLDEKNGIAYVTLGSWYIYAPQAAGGDDNYALELLKKSRDLGLNKFDLVSSWNMTALAYDRLQNPDKAAMAIDKALEISPLNQWVLEYQMRLQNNQPLENFYSE